MNLCTICGKGVDYSSKWNVECRCVPGEEGSFPTQPTPAHPQWPSEMWEKTHWIPREHSPAGGHDEAVWEEAVSQVWGQTPTAVGYACTESQHPGAGSLLVPLVLVLVAPQQPQPQCRTRYLNEPWLDSHIFSAEQSISLIKQQITKPDESYDSSSSSVVLPSSWISFLLTSVTGRGEIAVVEAAGITSSFAFMKWLFGVGRCCLNPSKMKASGCGFYFGSGFCQLKPSWNLHIMTTVSSLLTLLM